MRRGVFFLTALVLAAAGYGLSPARAAEEPARVLFSHKTKPAALKARAIGFYSRGCLAGGAMLPVDGPAWQAMRLERNRNWGHPDLVALVERLARESKDIDGWPGLLVGDMAQPRGGPMLTGHRSHQVGLDADIWLMPMPDKTLSRAERAEKTGISAVSMIKDPFSINEKHWRPGHVTLLKRAAGYKEVERIFVHPAIKKALCEAAGPKAGWLAKIRPYWGHHYHFHIRIKCPPGSANCRDQKPPAPDAGCGKVLDDWFTLLRNAAKQKKKDAKPKKRKEIMVEDLPDECRAVLAADDATPAEYVSQPVSVPARASVTDAPVRKPASAPPPAPRPRSEAVTPPAPERKPGAVAAPPRPASAARSTSGPNLPWLQGVTTPGPPLPDRKPE